MTVSTALVGLISYYTTVFLSGVLQINPILEVSILVIGTLNGTVAGLPRLHCLEGYLKYVKP